MKLRLLLLCFIFSIFSTGVSATTLTSNEIREQTSELKRLKGSKRTVSENEIVNVLKKDTKNYKSKNSRGLEISDIENLDLKEIVNVQGKVVSLYENGWFSIETIDESVIPENNVMISAYAATTSKQKRVTTTKTFYSWAGLASWKQTLGCTFGYDGKKSWRIGGAASSIHTYYLYDYREKTHYYYSDSKKNPVARMSAHIFAKAGPVTVYNHDTHSTVSIDKTGKVFTSNYYN